MRKTKRVKMDETALQPEEPPRTEAEQERTLPLLYKLLAIGALVITGAWIIFLLYEAAVLLEWVFAWSPAS